MSEVNYDEKIIVSLWLLITSVLLGLVTALFLSVCIAVVWPAEEAIERMAAATIFIPVLWAVITFYGVLQKNQIKALISLIIVTLCSSILATLAIKLTTDLLG